MRSTSILRMRNVLDDSCRENQNTHFRFNNFSSANLTVYEIMWKNFVQSGQATDNNVTLRMFVLCWITETTHRIRNTYFSSTATIVERTRLNVAFVYTMRI
jgi:hypothetical protein